MHTCADRGQVAITLGIPAGDTGERVHGVARVAAAVGGDARVFRTGGSSALGRAVIELSLRARRGRRGRGRTAAIATSGHLPSAVEGVAAGPTRRREVAVIRAGKGRHGLAVGDADVQLDEVLGAARAEAEVGRGCAPQGGGRVRGVRGENLVPIAAAGPEGRDRRGLQAGDPAPRKGLLANGIVRVAVEDLDRIHRSTGGEDKAVRGVEGNVDGVSGADVVGQGGVAGVLAGVGVAGVDRVLHRVGRAALKADLARGREVAAVQGRCRSGVGRAWEHPGHKHGRGREEEGAEHNDGDRGPGERTR